MPSSSVAMAVASRSPIQMGRFSLLSGSRRMTIGVLVTGSSVRPPTVIRMKSSRLIASPIGPHCAAALPGRQSDRHQAVDHVVELVQVPALLDQGAVGRVAVHLAVAEAPGHLVLGVEPDDLFGALLHVLEHPVVRQVVVVAPVAQDDDRGALVHRGQEVPVEGLEGTPEVRVGVDVDDVAVERRLDRVVDVALLEEARDLAYLGDEDEAPHLRVEVLERVDELEHEARHVAHRVGDVAQHHHLRLLLALAVEDDAEGDAAVLEVLAHGVARVELPAAGPPERRGGRPCARARPGDSPESPSPCAPACAKRPPGKPCWMSRTPAWSAASRKSFSSRPESASRSARASGESSVPASSRRCFSWSRKRWNSSSLISSAFAVAAVSSLMASARPEKKSSKRVSKVGRSTLRFTMVARSVARTVRRSGSPTTASARSMAMLSASETRSPFWRNRFENSTSFASMDGG